MNAKKIDLFVILFGEVSGILADLSRKLLKGGKLDSDHLDKLIDFYTSQNLLITYSMHKNNAYYDKATKLIESMVNIIDDFAKLEKKKKFSLKDISGEIRGHLKKS